MKQTPYGITDWGRIPKESDFGNAGSLYSYIKGFLFTIYVIYKLVSAILL